MTWPIALSLQLFVGRMTWPPRTRLEREKVVVALPSLVEYGSGSDRNALSRVCKMAGVGTLPSQIFAYCLELSNKTAAGIWETCMPLPSKEDNVDVEDKDSTTSHSS